MKSFKKAFSLILAVIMIFCSASLTVFAASDFGYVYSDESQSAIYISSFSGTVDKNGYVEIPDEIDGLTVIGIAEGAFKSVIGLKGIYVPETLTRIENGAFIGNVDIQTKEKEDESFDTDDWFENHKHDYIISGSTLVSYKGNDEIITIPYNCEAIADGAFRNNDKIKTVYIEKELKKIGDSAFEDCDSLEKVVAGNGVYSLDVGKNAFKGTHWLENYPSDLVSLGTTLIKYKGTATYVAIPNVYTAIAEQAFYSGDNTSTVAYKVKVPVTIDTFADECFYLYDSITKVYPELVIFKDSDAEKYCREAGLDYDYAALPGDVDKDGAATAADARYVLRIAAKLESPIIDRDIMEVADITGDSKINAEDARLILRVSAKLDKYSAEELLSMPRTDYEILFASTSALASARAYGVSYSKYAYGEMHDVDMNYNSTLYFDIYKNELTSADKAQTVTYPKDSEEGYNNLFEISLIDGSKIKEYSCMVKDSNYIFNLTLKDEHFNGDDVDAVSYTRQMFPVDSVAHFTNKVKGKYWYNDSIDYNMTYRDCSLELHVEIATGKVVLMNVEMNYDFEVTGKVGGIQIKGSNGPATATRTDVIKYRNFNYFGF